MSDDQLVRFGMKTSSILFLSEQKRQINFNWVLETYGSGFSTDLLYSAQCKCGVIFPSDSCQPWSLNILSYLLLQSHCWDFILIIIWFCLLSSGGNDYWAACSRPCHVTARRPGIVCQIMRSHAMWFVWGGLLNPKLILTIPSRYLS